MRRRVPTGAISEDTVRHLYASARTLSEADRKTLGMRVPCRIYVQDPLVAEVHPALGVRAIEVDWEPGLTDGPTSARFAVVDYDADRDALHPPARWDADRRCFADADDPRDVRFHQVNAWAIAQSTLNLFEDRHVMGRPIPWAFEGNRLIVVPHAGRQRNAFYDRRSGSLRFYYAGPDERAIYTCLSHDIVAHETGHAILDGIRPYYNAISSPQTAAFHEFLADLTAMLAAMRNREVRAAIARISGGDLRGDRVIADLAEQLGGAGDEGALGGASRSYLRSAHNDDDLVTLAGEWEAHRLSEVMTGALFDALAEMAIRERDRSARARGRDATALWRASDRLTRMALRALDYCPPVDIQFADYAAALLFADELAYPRDSFGYRELLAGVFRARGLGALPTHDQPRHVDFLWRQDVDSIFSSRTNAYHFLNDNRRRLGIPANQDVIVADLYTTDKVVEAEQRLPREVVLLYAWREDVFLEGARFGRLAGSVVPLWCGGTLVFDGRGNVRSFVHKPGVELERGRAEGESRRQRLLDYVAALKGAGMIGVSGEEGDVASTPWAPAVIGERLEGTLHLTMTPGLLHGSDT